MLRKKTRKKTSSVKKKVKSEKFYITAFDPKIKKRVAFVVENGIAKSTVTNTKFKYKG